MATATLLPHINSISPFQTPMAFSSAGSFIHFPTAISSSTNNFRPSPAPSAKRRASLGVKCHGGGAEPEEKDPFETIDKLYKNIKNEDIAPFQPKSKKSNFVSNIIKALQDSIIFIVQPATRDGSMVGVKWKLGWKKPLMEWENGISIHSHHSYVGKLLIGNLENLIDPVLRLAPNTLRKWYLEPTKQRRAASLCLGFFLLLLSLFSFKFSVR